MDIMIYITPSLPITETFFIYLFIYIFEILNLAYKLLLTGTTKMSP